MWGECQILNSFNLFEVVWNVQNFGFWDTYALIKGVFCFGLKIIRFSSGSLLFQMFLSKAPTKQFSTIHKNLWISKKTSRNSYPQIKRFHSSFLCIRKWHLKRLPNFEQKKKDKIQRKAKLVQIVPDVFFSQRSYTKFSFNKNCDFPSPDICEDVGWWCWVFILFEQNVAKLI